MKHQTILVRQRCLVSFECALVVSRVPLLVAVLNAFFKGLLYCCGTAKSQEPCREPSEPLLLNEKRKARGGSAEMESSRAATRACVCELVLAFFPIRNECIYMIRFQLLFGVVLIRRRDDAVAAKPSSLLLSQSFLGVPRKQPHAFRVSPARSSPPVHLGWPHATTLPPSDKRRQTKESSGSA